MKTLPFTLAASLAALVTLGCTGEVAQPVTTGSHTASPSADQQVSKVTFKVDGMT
ncbi:MAG: hypothetical protein R3F34_13025 [Planctomycetota bacterium]